jgi:hypothetical protein
MLAEQQQLQKSLVVQANWGRHMLTANSTFIFPCTIIGYNQMKAKPGKMYIWPNLLLTQNNF